LARATNVARTLNNKHQPRARLTAPALTVWLQDIRCGEITDFWRSFPRTAPTSAGARPHAQGRRSGVTVAKIERGRITALETSDVDCIMVARGDRVRPATPRCRCRNA
jgi:hypothetical protein